MAKILPPKRKMRNTTPITKPKVGKGMRMLSPQPMSKGGYAEDTTELPDNRPRISFYSDQIPELKDAVIGEKKTLCIEVEVVGTNISEYGDHKGEICIDMKINKVGLDNDDDE